MLCSTVTNDTATMPGVPRLECVAAGPASLSQHPAPASAHESGELRVPNSLSRTRSTNVSLTPRGPTSSTEQRPGGAPWLPAGYTRRVKRPLPVISNGAVTELPGARKTMEDHRRPGEG